MSESGVNADGYVLQRTSAEHQRLARQALIWEPATRQALARTGLGPGMSALDVGCGTGSVMRLMGELVGNSGRVIGVDGDRSLGREALQSLRSERSTHFDFIEADLVQLESVRDQTFDLVFARLLLIHLPDAVGALRRFWSWVKPGGALLIMDYDMTVSRYFPHSEPHQQASALLQKLLVAAGKDIEIGARMPELFRTAGIGVPDACDVSSVVRLVEAGGGNMGGALAAMREGAVAAGWVDAAQFDAIDAQLRATAGGEVFTRMPDLTATWKRKALRDGHAQR
jgi:ubiquinone/menaquinone biosynthesis C-methylase UbiE